MGDFDRKLPIGIQDFESIRRDGYLYIDIFYYFKSLTFASACVIVNPMKRRIFRTLDQTFPGNEIKEV
ncbi:MAG: hypothetical protein K6G27_15155 [Lachnospiraceae bacterium]|nr:hypothetical protein [Lachnospiraceae bacterium]